MTASQRLWTSKVCFAIAVVILLLALISVHIGEADLQIAGWLFIALGLLIA